MPVMGDEVGFCILIPGSRSLWDIHIPPVPVPIFIVFMRVQGVARWTAVSRSSLWECLLFRGSGDVPGRDAFAVEHIDEMTVGRELFQECGCQLGIFEKRLPLRES